MIWEGMKKKQQETIVNTQKQKKMNAHIAGALEQINKSYKVFRHRGRRMTKEEVRAVLEYGIGKGYETTGQISDEEVDAVLNNIITEK